MSQKILIDNNIEVLSDDVDSNWEVGCKKSFDVIIMRHVLEHFLNPLEVLRKVHYVLKDTGVLYLAVPNNLLENRNEGWLRVPHTYYFNKYTLTSILNKAKLEISSITTKDEFNAFEIYVFAKKSEIDINLIFDKEVYDLQKYIFRKVLNKEKNIFIIKTYLKKWLMKNNSIKIPEKHFLKKLKSKLKNQLKKYL